MGNDAPVVPNCRICNVAFGVVADPAMSLWFAHPAIDAVTFVPSPKTGPLALVGRSRPIGGIRLALSRLVADPPD